MAHSDSDPAAADAAAPPEAAGQPPAARELGIREARGQLGELADRARYLDEITYLTKHRTRIAAVVPAEAARSRGQLAGTVEQSAAEAEQMRRDYERLHRAADAALEAREVLWARAYLRVWAVLDHLATDFYDTVENAVIAELEAERNRPAPGAADDDDDWAQDGPPLDVRYLSELIELREREKARRDFASAIEDRVAELERADDHFRPGQEHTLDWTGWAERIEHLVGVIAAGGPAVGPGIVWNARQRLANALAEAATMLGELETSPPADVPADVTGYTAREIWAGAAGIIGGPLVTSYASLAKQLHLMPESARRAMVELHRAGRVRLFRYFHGRQSEVDPAQLHEQATFHLVLIGDCDDVDLPRPTVIVDL